MIWTLAKKELRLLLRDPKAAVILLVMPFLFILVLGVSLGEGFGQKPDDRLRISIVELDRGPPRGADPRVLGASTVGLGASPAGMAPFSAVSAQIAGRNPDLRAMVGEGVAWLGTTPAPGGMPSVG